MQTVEDATHRSAMLSWWHPTRPAYRITVLILICNITFGSYYCYDIPGALKGQLFDQFKDMTQLQYNLLYSLYSWPNTVQVFFGGYIIDRYLGVRWGCAICCSVLVVGQALVCLGVQLNRVDLLLAGRFLFGVGGETLAVAQSAYAAQWFKGAELATAFGIVLSFSRIGSAVNFDISPAVVEHFNQMRGGTQGLVWAMYVGNMFCVFSLMCCLALNFLDYRAEQTRLDTDSVASAASEEGEEEPVKMSDCLAFPLTVWLVFLVTITFYAAVFVFLQNGVQFVHQRYLLTEKNSSFLMSVPYTVAAIACPVFGALVDKTGRALLWILLATTALAAIQVSVVN
jgi:MFS family permease